MTRENEEARKRIESFVRRALVGAREPIEEIVIRTVTPSGKRGESVGGIECGGDLDSEVKLDDRVRAWSDEIHSQCDDYAAGLEGAGAQAFELAVVVGGKVARRSTVRFFAESNLDEPGDAQTEPATIVGMLKQQMRHNEGMTRMVLSAVTQITTAQNNTIALLSERASDAEKEKRRAFEAYAEVRAGQREHEIEIETIRGENRRKEQVFDAVKGLLPAIASKVSGGKLALDGKSGDPVSQMVASLVDSMDQEQALKIAAHFTPAQQALLMEIYEARANAREAEARTAAEREQHDAANGTNGVQKEN